MNGPGGGRVVHVIVLSSQLVSVTWAEGPATPLASVTKRRSFTELTVPVTPLTVNLRYECVSDAPL